MVVQLTSYQWGSIKLRILAGNKTKRFSAYFAPMQRGAKRLSAYYCANAAWCLFLRKAASPQSKLSFTHDRSPHRIASQTGHVVVETVSWKWLGRACVLYCKLSLSADNARRMRCCTPSFCSLTSQKTSKNDCTT